MGVSTCVVCYSSVCASKLGCARSDVNGRWKATTDGRVHNSRKNQNCAAPTGSQPGCIVGGRRQPSPERAAQQEPWYGVMWLTGSTTFQPGLPSGHCFNRRRHAGTHRDSGAGDRDLVLCRARLSGSGAAVLTLASAPLPCWSICYQVGGASCSSSCCWASRARTSLSQ